MLLSIVLLSIALVVSLVSNYALGQKVKLTEAKATLQTKLIEKKIYELKGLLEEKEVLFNTLEKIHIEFKKVSQEELKAIKETYSIAKGELDMEKQGLLSIVRVVCFSCIEFLNTSSSANEFISGSRKEVLTSDKMPKWVTDFYMSSDFEAIIYALEEHK